jgi:hypothetical protein
MESNSDFAPAFILACKRRRFEGEAQNECRGAYKPGCKRVGLFSGEATIILNAFTSRRGF